MYVKVRAVTNAKEELVVEEKPAHLKISVREKPERNLANTRIIGLVAAFYGVSPKKVKIISGHHHPHKMCTVDIEKK
jgi:uncharacterized protein YggU (UPF0235/DUF167 family)